MSLLDHLSEPTRHAVDALSVGAIIGTAFSWLPQFSALLAAGWFLLRIANELLERRIKQQEYRINERKEIAQRDAVKTYRDHLNDTAKEGVTPEFQRLLDRLK